MIISVFGGSAPQPGEPAYEEARRLGYELGSQGHTLLTGGYIGVMEAVSLGGHEANAHVIGATCAELKNSGLCRKANPYIDEEWQFQSLQERLLALIERCDAAIAMPGGVGTLAEISLMWNKIIIDALPKKPLVLFGKGWRTIFSKFLNEFGSYVSIKDRELITYIEDIPALLEFMRLNSKN